MSTTWTGLWQSCRQEYSQICEHLVSLHLCGDLVLFPRATDFLLLVLPLGYNAAGLLFGTVAGAVESSL